MHSEQQCFAVVAGESKAGTSSIFRYLGDHPEIQPSVVKQTNYFLTREYKWSKNDQALLYEEDKGQSFSSLFGKTSKNVKVLLDVSPDYLYCDESPQFLQEHFTDKNYFIIVILRDPIQRLLSWYRFGKQIQLVPEDMDITTFLKKQGDTGAGSMAFNAMESGRFLQYLKRYEKFIPSERLITVSYDQLKDNPAKLLSDMARRFDVSPDFYADYEFNVHNRTEQVRSGNIQKIYIKCQRKLHKLLSSQTYLQPIMKYPVRLIAKTYRRFNLAAPDAVKLSQQEEAHLKNYYSAEYDFLRTLDVTRHQQPG
ncbi:MAG: sulfotransferase domain-containing protein [Granulosicoccus sp.]